MTEHPSRERIRGFLEGRLEPGSGRVRVLRHLLGGCARCRTVAIGLVSPSRFEPLPEGSYRGAVASVLRSARRLSQTASAQALEAVPLVDELVRHPPARQLTIVRNHRRFQTVPLVQELCRRTHALVGSNPSEAVRLGRLAVATADALEPDRYPPDLANDFRCCARVYLADAQRLSGALPASHRTFADARERFRKGTHDLGDLAYLTYKESVLRKDQGRFQEALLGLRGAFRLYSQLGDYHFAGKVLIDSCVAHLESGDPATAARELWRASGLIDPKREPRLVLAIYHNLAVTHCHAEMPEQALAFLADARPLYESIGKPREQLRRLWLEGSILLSQGEVDAAAERFAETRDGFARLNQPLEAALASLELALAYAEQGRTADLRSLSAQMLPVFRNAGLQREALAALTFFHRSVETDRATVLAIERVVSFLNELKEKPALRFHLREPPGN